MVMYVHLPRVAVPLCGLFVSGSKASCTIQQEKNNLKLHMA